MAIPERFLFAGFFLKSLRDLERASVRVRLNCALVEDRDGNLGIWGLRTELVVRVTHALANSVDTDESARRQEVLAL